MKLAIMGWGMIGQGVGQAIVEQQIPGVQLHTVLARRPETVTGCGDAIVTGTVSDLLATEPDLFVEALGRDGLLEVAPQVLNAGKPVIVMSSSTLTDDTVRADYENRARASGARLLVPSGAIAGVDALSAARFGGFDDLQITQRKLPKAVLGPDADPGAGTTTVASSVAREAGERFPKNANVTVTAALAARALDSLQFQLVADPDADLNTTEIRATGAFGSLDLRLRSRPTSNGRTSKMAIFSALAAIERQSSAIVIGA